MAAISRSGCPPSDGHSANRQPSAQVRSHQSICNALRTLRKHPVVVRSDPDWTEFPAAAGAVALLAVASQAPVLATGKVAIAMLRAYPLLTSEDGLTQVPHQSWLRICSGLLSLLAAATAH